MFHQPLWKLAATTCVTALLVASLNAPVLGLLSDDDNDDKVPSAPPTLTTDPLIPEDYRKAIAIHAPILFDDKPSAESQSHTVETLARLPIPLIHKLLIHPVIPNSNHSSSVRCGAIHDLIRTYDSWTRSQIDFILEHTGPLFRQIGAQDYVFVRHIAMEMSPQTIRAITKYLSPLLPQTSDPDLIPPLFRLFIIEQTKPEDIKAFGQKLHANRNLFFKPQVLNPASSETSLRIKGLDLATRPPSTTVPILPEEIALIKDLFEYHRHDLDDFAQAFSQCVPDFFNKPTTWEEYKEIKGEVARLPRGYMRALAMNPHLSPTHKKMFLYYKDDLMTLKLGHLRFLHLFAPVIFFQADHPTNVCLPFDPTRYRHNLAWKSDESHTARRLRMLARLTVPQLNVISTHGDVFFAKGMITPPYDRSHSIARERHHQASEEKVTAAFTAIINHLSSKSPQEIEELAGVMKEDDGLLKKLNCKNYRPILLDLHILHFNFDLDKGVEENIPADYDWSFMAQLTSFSASQVHAIAHHQESLLYKYSRLYDDFSYRQDLMRTLCNYLGALSAPEIAIFAGHMDRLKEGSLLHSEAYLQAYLQTTWSPDKREILLKHRTQLLLTDKNEHHNTANLRALNCLSVAQIEAVIANGSLLPMNISERLSLLEKLPTLTPDEIKVFSPEEEEEEEEEEDQTLEKTSVEQPDKPLWPAPPDPFEDAEFMKRVEPYIAFLFPHDGPESDLFTLLNLLDKPIEQFEPFMATLQGLASVLLPQSFTNSQRRSAVLNLCYLPTDQLPPLAEKIKRENLTAYGISYLIWSTATDWEVKQFNISCQEENQKQQESIDQPD